MRNPSIVAALRAEAAASAAVTIQRAWKRIFHHPDNPARRKWMKRKQGELEAQHVKRRRQHHDGA